MVVLEMLSWWYGRGWMTIAKNTEARFFKVSHMFSVPILVRTLFAPWRRIVTYPGASLQAKFDAARDNLVSRVVGFTVRSAVLLAAGLMLALSTIVAGVQLILWPLVPPAVIVLCIKGIIG